MTATLASAQAGLWSLEVARLKQARVALRRLGVQVRLAQGTSDEGAMWASIILTASGIMLCHSYEQAGRIDRLVHGEETISE